MTGDGRTYDLTRPARPGRWFVLAAWSAVLIGIATVIYVLFFRPGDSTQDTAPQPAPGQVRRPFALGDTRLSLLLDDGWTVTARPDRLQAVLTGTPSVAVDWRLLPDTAGRSPEACAERWLEAEKGSAPAPVRVFRSRWLDRKDGIAVCELVLGFGPASATETDRDHRVYLRAGDRILLVTFRLVSTTPFAVEDRVQSLVSSVRF